MYQQLIDDAMLRRQSIREPDGFWHPSSMTGCQRAAVYEQTGTEKTDPTQIRNVRIMDNGTRVHEFVQAEMIRKLVKDGAQPSAYLAEVDVDAFGIKGSCDALLAVSDGFDNGSLEPVYELQEYKSISPTGKKFMKPKPYGKDGPNNKPVPKPEHVKQARIYYMCLESQGYLLDGIRIVYFDRDDWSVLEFEVEPWDAIEAGTFLTELDALKMHSQYGTLPKRMDPDYWQCRYCNFKTRCWEQDKETTRA